MQLKRRSEIDKFVFEEYKDRGRIDPLSYEFYINGNRWGQQVECNLTITPYVIHDRTYYENELKYIKVQIQRDEEEAQKLMNKDFDKSKIIEEIEKKIEECENTEEDYSFHQHKSLEDIIEMLKMVNMKFVENPGYNEDHTLCLQVFIAFSLKL